ncbi:GxxExxY protein [Sulfuricella sp.]|uniref:GxxExxY protein n=1 Tax=Sulfuricella sp. TaxID=2099377 RepID=UPI002CB7378D|nr:GxxExxY protein [Sulfuricella sp.]HUX62972.1 GxxExxY protein [Sulfuricella sp.]
MNTNQTKILHQELAYQIVGLAMQAHTRLGNGFLEKVYENALMVLLRKAGINAVQQAPITVLFDGESVGTYYADILIESKIILELKTVSEISDSHKAQTLNYLKATGLNLAMVFNFANPRLEYQRVVL